jgi:peptidoglycan/xylan/chitin deacetylase (PgdA/CDA1 family)
MGYKHSSELNSGMKQHNRAEITKWKNNAAAALTLSFDDGYKETIQNCAQYLAKCKLRATWIIPTAYVGDIFEGRDIVSWSDIGEMAQQLNMEIASHSVNHLTSPISPLEYLFRVPTEFYYASSKLAYLRQIFARAFGLLTRKKPIKCSTKETPLDIEYEVNTSKSEIDKQVTSQTVLSYVYPYGKYNRPYKDCIRSAGYLSARGSFKGYNIYETMDFFDLKCMVWSKYTTLKEADSWLDKAMATGAWLIETYHLVTGNNHPEYQWFTPVGVFQQHVEHLSNLAENNKVWVDTQQSIAKYMKQRLNSKVSILHQDSEGYTLRLSNEIAQLSDQELTLRVEIPDQWHEIRVSQDGRPIAAQKERNFVLFSALPNAGDILIENMR